MLFYSDKLYFLDQSNFKLVNNATPALIHFSSSIIVGNSTNITKLVECPVVDKVPYLARVL